MNLLITNLSETLTRFRYHYSARKRGRSSYRAFCKLPCVTLVAYVAESISEDQSTHSRTVLSCDKGHLFFDIRLRHQYTHNCPFCVLPCCRYPQSARDRRFNSKAKNPHFLPLLCLKRPPFLPSLVVREQSKFTLTNSKISMRQLLNLLSPISPRFPFYFPLSGLLS